MAPLNGDGVDNTWGHIDAVLAHELKGLTTDNELGALAVEGGTYSVEWLEEWLDAILGVTAETDSAASQLRSLDDLPVLVDLGEIEMAIRPFLVSEGDNRRWDKVRGTLWRDTIGRLAAGRVPVRDRDLIEREYAVWATLGYDRYRTGRKDLKAMPWEWRGRRLFLDGAVAARIRTVLLSAVLDHLKPRRVLEVGSGHGINLLSLAGAFPDIEFIGLELTREGVEQSRHAQSDGSIAQILRDHSPSKLVDPSAIERVKFTQGDASAMPFEADSFDLVITVLAVEQMETIRSAALSEISRVAKRHVLMLEPFSDVNERGLRRLYVQSRGYFRGSIDGLRVSGLEPLWATSDFPQESFLGTALVLARSTSR